MVRKRMTKVNLILLFLRVNIIYTYTHLILFLIYRKNISNLQNVSIVRIFYPFASTNIYTTDILYTWQELIGKAI